VGLAESDGNVDTVRMLTITVTLSQQKLSQSHRTSLRRHSFNGHFPRQPG